MARTTQPVRLCRACKAAGATSDRFCSSCGTLAGEPLDCERHPGRPAEAACVVCGMPLCLSCTTERPALCPDPEHAAIAAHWVRLIAVNSEFESDCITQNLTERGVPSRSFSSRRFDSAGPTDASDAVRVFVKKEDLARAEQCLADLTGPLEGEPDPIEQGN